LTSVPESLRNLTVSIRKWRDGVLAASAVTRWVATRCLWCVSCGC